MARVRERFRKSRQRARCVHRCAVLIECRAVEERSLVEGELQCGVVTGLEGVSRGDRPVTGTRVVSEELCCVLAAPSFECTSDLRVTREPDLRRELPLDRLADLIVIDLEAAAPFARRRPQQS